jgi:hypothetical protein
MRRSLVAAVSVLVATVTSIPACTNSVQSGPVKLRCQFEGRDQAIRVSLALDLEQGTATRIPENIPPEQSLWTGNREEWRRHSTERGILHLDGFSRRRNPGSDIDLALGRESQDWRCHDDCELRRR